MPETRKRHVPSSSGSTSPTHKSVSSSGPNKDEASRSFSHTLGLLIIFISLSCVTTLFLLPSPIEPIEYSLPLPPEFIGPLAENKLLAKADKLFLDRLRGPESITVHNGKLFTGTADGKILEINGDDIRVVATLGKPPCGKFDDEPTCGRPLGMRFDKDGSLVVVDAYLGLFRVNVETGKFVQLYSPETLVDGEQAAFLNDLDIDSDGTVYFTDSSTNWGRRYNRYAAMEAKKNGRLLAYNPNTKQTEVILKNMSFPNGVQLSPEKDFILIAELCTCKILQYSINTLLCENSVFVNSLFCDLNGIKCYLCYVP
ncbi:adipocyte plasma membrane-associated protein [Lingula anatina]|uniref:Adipocyte plasma membrane-associated protein n=1 Tax=Lingula anatina TaxID=7574 RepID=A0A1S3ID31_LINAN|nr:adipocyte plasma membrane-associated protein [Lingula anatina]XP_013395344.1 adipocyte plasma membrane-associated protein [Lingula anatina]|eukprot:XP_013395343.1 adipocyte plasma membrane-associated protein [Lingula anatina]